MFLRCFLSADEVWAVSVLADVKAFYSSYTETEQFLNSFIKMSAVPISRQIKQQWISNKGVFIQNILKQKKEKIGSFDLWLALALWNVKSILS